MKCCIFYFCFSSAFVLFKQQHSRGIKMKLDIHNIYLGWLEIWMVPINSSFRILSHSLCQNKITSIWAFLLCLTQQQNLLPLSCKQDRVQQKFNSPIKRLPHNIRNILSLCTSTDTQPTGHRIGSHSSWLWPMCCKINF